MKLGLSTSGKHDAQLVWLAALLVVVAGYFLVFRTLEERIAGENAATENIVATLTGNAAIVRERPALEQRKRDIDARLRGLALHGDRATSMAAFIQECARIASVHYVRVAAIDASRADVRPAGSHDAFEGLALDLTLLGDYRGLLAAIRDLSHARTLAQIDISSIERRTARKASDTRALEVRLHVLVQRLRDTVPASPASNGVTRVFSRSS